MSNISTAIAIQEAAKEAMYSEYVMQSARDFVETLVDQPSDHHIKMLFKYSSMLSAAVAARLTEVLMTESEFNAMMLEINEMESLGNQIEQE